MVFILTVSKDNFEENKTESVLTAPQAVEKRLEKNIIISSILFVLFAFLFGSNTFATGTCIGVALSYINYRWLSGSIKTILIEVTQGQEAPKGMAAVRKFILRWLIILVILMFSGSLSGKDLTLGITIGLLSFGGAAILEAITQVGSIIYQK
jgi:hypothetical protein